MIIFNWLNCLKWKSFNAKTYVFRILIFFWKKCVKQDNHICSRRKWCTSIHRLTFRLLLNHLVTLKRVFTYTSTYTSIFSEWPIVFRKEYHLHSHHSNLLPQIVDFSLICDCSFLNYLNPQDWWSAVPLFSDDFRGIAHLIGHSRKKDTMRKVTTWPDFCSRISTVLCL